MSYIYKNSRRSEGFTFTVTSIVVVVKFVLFLIWQANEKLIFKNNNTELHFA